MVMNAETYLRLSCEAFLAPSKRLQAASYRSNPMAEAAAAARALIAAGSLDENSANLVFEEYDVALRARGHEITARHWGDRRAASEAMSEKVDLTASRALVGHYPVGEEGAELVLHELVFADGAVYAQLSWASAQMPSSSQNRNTPPPDSVIMSDDRGASATASRGWASHSQGYWEAAFQTDKPLSSATVWLQVDGAHVLLPPPAPRPEVRAEAIPAPTEPFKAFLLHELMSTQSRSVVDAAVGALVATGLLSAAEPMLAEVERVVEAVVDRRPFGGVPEPWASLFGRVDKHDGPVGSMPIGVAVTSKDGWSVRFHSLISQRKGFRVILAASPPSVLVLEGRALVGMMGGHVDPLRTQTVPVEWRAEDDVGNLYLATARFGGGSSPGVVNGELWFLSPLDPKARQLSLIATGLHERAVVTISLAELEEL